MRAAPNQKNIPSPDLVGKKKQWFLTSKAARKTFPSTDQSKGHFTSMLIEKRAFFLPSRNMRFEQSYEPPHQIRNKPLLIRIGLVEPFAKN